MNSEADGFVIFLIYLLAPQEILFSEKYVRELILKSTFTLVDSPGLPYNYENELTKRTIITI